MLLDSDQLKLFKLIYEHQSLSKAAKKFPISISKASRLLGKIRDTFADELFYHSNQGLYPNKFAEQLYPKVLTLLNDIASLKEGKSFSPANLKRTFVIGCLDIDMVSAFAPLMSKLRKEAPGVKFHFKHYNDEFFTELKKGTVDLVFQHSMETPSGFQRLTLCQDSYVYVPQKNSHFAERARNGEILQESELQKNLIAQPTVPVMNQEQAYLSQFDEDVSNCTFDTRIFTPFFTSVVYFLQGEDTTVVPLQTAVRLTEYVPIEILGRPSNLPEYPYSMIWFEQRGHDAAHQWLRSWLYTEITKTAVDVSDVHHLE